MYSYPEQCRTIEELQNFVRGNPFVSLDIRLRVNRHFVRLTSAAEVTDAEQPCSTGRDLLELDFMDLDSYSGSSHDNVVGVQELYKDLLNSISPEALPVLENDTIEDVLDNHSESSHDKAVGVREFFKDLLDSISPEALPVLENGTVEDALNCDARNDMFTPEGSISSQVDYNALLCDDSEIRLSSAVDDLGQNCDFLDMTTLDMAALDNLFADTVVNTGDTAGIQKTYAELIDTIPPNFLDDSLLNIDEVNPVGTEQNGGGVINIQQEGAARNVQQEGAPNENREPEGGGGEIDGEAREMFGTFQILNRCKRYVRKFRTEFDELQLHINQMPLNVNPVDWIDKIFSEIVQIIQGECGRHDRVGLEIRCANDDDVRPIFVTIRRQDQLTADVITNIFEKVIQSGKNVFLEGPIVVNYIRCELPNGGRRNRFPGLLYNDFCARKRGITVVKNDDSLCLPRAIVVGKASADGDPDFVKIRKDVNMAQSLRAIELCMNADVNLDEIWENGSGLDEIRRFQDFLTEYTITVFEYGDKIKPIFVGPLSTPAQERKNIDLLLHEKHFNVVASIRALFSADYYCRECDAAWNAAGEHFCKDSCKRCHSKPKCVETQGFNLVCRVCNYNFRNQQCFDTHRTKSQYTRKRTVCDVKRICGTCSQPVNMVRRKSKHECGEIFCTTCQAFVKPDHACFMQIDPLFKKAHKPFALVFYDLECRQDENYAPGDDSVKKHVPNLCVSQTMCNTCLANGSADDMTVPCENCGVRQNIFEGDNCIEDFYAYLSAEFAAFKEVTIFAHNSRSYDSILLVQNLIKKTGFTPEIILQGNKLMSLKIKKFHFKDSLNFLPMSLAKLPEALNLVNLKKGWFPHFFNTRENANYVGVMPPAEAYGPDSMNVSERQKFEAWYREQQDQPFDMRKEILEYCISDVTILRQACIKFRELYLQETGVDPLRETLTLASLCMKVFRRNILKPNTVGLIPLGGYRAADRQSQIAIEWLNYESQRAGVHIQHAKNSREKRLGRLKVDGFCSETHTLYEFMGCHWHGCPMCKRDKQMHTGAVNPQNETFAQRYDQTQARLQRLRRLGYTVIEMWECTYMQMKKTDPELIRFLRENPSDTPEVLDPRNAFFGGRTNCTKIYVEAKDGSKIRYQDVCSLYPFVQKTGVYVVGHPKIYLGAECPDINTFVGLIKCTILPPEKLYLPVLPVRKHGKLLFPLCNKCADMSGEPGGAPEICDHTDVERAFSGTWVSLEIIQAVKQGYKIIKTDEVWAYETTQYDPLTKTGGLFAEYIDQFLKIKTEASGWPKDCTTEEQKNDYIRRFRDREGVDLDPEKVAYNPGLRSIAKLSLNSLWGKLAERSDLQQSTIVSDVAEHYSLLSDPNVEVKTIFPLTEDKELVNWRYDSNSCCGSRTRNIVVAAFVTCQARLVLYEYLEKLGRRTIYFDTDSVLYVSRPGDVDLENGQYLGDLTCELEQYGKGSYIMNFVCGGPKNYAFKVARAGNPHDTTTVCKVRGITINSGNAHLVNFDTLRRMVLGQETGIVVPIPHQIARVNKFDVVTRASSKIFRTVFTKRTLGADGDEFDSLPFGYKRARR